MKKKIINLSLIVVLLLEFATISFSNNEKDRVYENPFKIISRKIDKTIPSGKTKLNFTFIGPKGKMEDVFQIGFNDHNFELKSNVDGKTTYTSEVGKYILYFYLSGYKEVITDTITLNSQENMEIEIQFTYQLRQIRPAKPVIYLYPDNEKEVNILLHVKGELGFTYPIYNNGWNVTAFPNGNIKMDDKEFNYLFWESEMSMKELTITKKEGYIVDKDSLLTFLENSLNQMGLNSKESADFITYWYPQMLKNETNAIQFLFNEECDAYAELKITPTPNHIYRVGMLWANGNHSMLIERQTLPKINREGFSVLEWGGIEMPHLFTIEN
jgi:hypothetical protein